MFTTRVPAPNQGLVMSSYPPTQSWIRGWCWSPTGQKVKGDVNACLHEGVPPRGSRQRVPSRGSRPEGPTQRVPSRGSHPEGPAQRVPPRGSHPEGLRWSRLVGGVLSL